MPRWVSNRWFVVPALFAVVVAAWNSYIALNNGGVVEGRVVDRQGRPVPGASVALLERHFVLHNERQRTRTDGEGRFRFSGNDSHSLQLEAEAAGLGRSERKVVRLWFRAQNVRLDEPIVLGEKAP